MAIIESISTPLRDLIRTVDQISWHLKARWPQEGCRSYLDRLFSTLQDGNRLLPPGLKPNAPEMIQLVVRPWQKVFGGLEECGILAADDNVINLTRTPQVLQKATTANLVGVVIIGSWTLQCRYLATGLDVSTEVQEIQKKLDTFQRLVSESLALVTQYDMPTPLSEAIAPDITLSSFPGGCAGRQVSSYIPSNPRIQPAGRLSVKFSADQPDQSSQDEDFATATRQSVCQETQTPTLSQDVALVPPKQILRELGQRHHCLRVEETQSDYQAGIIYPVSLDEKDKDDQEKEKEVEEEVEEESADYVSDGQLTEGRQVFSYTKTLYGTWSPRYLDLEERISAWSRNSEQSS